MSDDEVVRVWTQVGRQSQGSPVSVAHVCAAAVAGLGADGAAVTLMINSTLRDTVHATDQRASELEEWQLALGQGPCVDAFALGGPVLAPDLGSPDFSHRWPAFTPVALDSGARALFALPMRVGAVRLGVLDLYRTRPGALTSYELSDALVFADAAGMLLLDGAAGTLADGTHPDGTHPYGTHPYGFDTGGLHPDGSHRDGTDADGAYPGGSHLGGAHQGQAELAWPHDPTAQQAQVHQATGMILVQLGVTAEAAFARLRAYAYAHDRRLGDVAREVVGRRLRFDPDPVPGDHDGGQR